MSGHHSKWPIALTIGDLVSVKDSDEIWTDFALVGFYRCSVKGNWRILLFNLDDQGKPDGAFKMVYPNRLWYAGWVAPCANSSPCSLTRTPRRTPARPAHSSLKSKEKILLTESAIDKGNEYLADLGKLALPPQAPAPAPHLPSRRRSSRVETSRHVKQATQAKAAELKKAAAAAAKARSNRSKKALATRLGAGRGRGKAPYGKRPTKMKRTKKQKTKTTSTTKKEKQAHDDDEGDNDDNDDALWPSTLSPHVSTRRRFSKIYI